MGFSALQFLANYSVVFARLIYDRTDYGVHTFLVQLRDIETHQVLPNLSLGDCGHKLGYNGVDNGWIQFHDVRIPYENMLSRFASVSRDGKYTQQKGNALAIQRYALIRARIGVVYQAVIDASLALTIATRYAISRRQFSDSKDGSEKKIMDYQTHKYRLLPALAEVYATKFVLSKLLSFAQEIDAEIMKEKPEIPDVNDLHALSAGMKASASWALRDIIIVCRDCCGGHGYSGYNGIARLICDSQIGTTWDGDNSVLSQQTARYVLNSFMKISQGESLDGRSSVSYLLHTEQLMHSKFGGNSKTDLNNLHHFLHAFQWRAATLCFNVSKKMQEIVAEGKSPTVAWNECLVDLVQLSKVHCQLHMLTVFINIIHEKTSSQTCTNYLKKLALLFAADSMKKDMGMFRMGNFVTSSQAELIWNHVLQLCDELRVVAVSLVDAFEYPDEILDAPLGAYDGNIYPKYFEKVLEHDKTEKIPPYFDDFIKPIVTKNLTPESVKKA